MIKYKEPLLIQMVFMPSQQILNQLIRANKNKMNEKGSINLQQNLKLENQHFRLLSMNQSKPFSYGLLIHRNWIGNKDLWSTQSIQRNERLSSLPFITQKSICTNSKISNMKEKFQIQLPYIFFPFHSYFSSPLDKKKITFP